MLRKVPRTLGLTILCLLAACVGIRLQNQLALDRFLSPSVDVFSQRGRENATASLHKDLEVVKKEDSSASSDPSDFSLVVEDDVSEPPSHVGKPSFIIHVGPSKSGTTTLQNDGGSFTSVLSHDHYVYFGRGEDAAWRGRTVLDHMLHEPDCFVEMETDFMKDDAKSASSGNGPSCFVPVLDELEKWSQLNQSIIISDEVFSYQRRLDSLRNVSFYYEVLKAALEPWSVLIVGTYRRYGEWLLSSVKEAHAATCMQEGWPHQDGKACSSPWALIQQWMDRPTSSARVYRGLDDHLPEWEKHGFETAILNFHGGSHLTTAFFCDLLHDAPATCRHCKERPVQSHFNARSVDTAAYDSIVFAAAERGLMNLNQTRLQAVTDLAEYHQNNLNLTFQDLPLLCPSRRQLQELLNKSLALEEKLLPEFFKSPIGEREHRTSFWRLVDSKEYCSVHTEALLEHAISWGQVLERLNRTDWTDS